MNAGGSFVFVTVSSSSSVTRAEPSVATTVTAIGEASASAFDGAPPIAPVSGSIASPVPSGKPVSE